MWFSLLTLPAHILRYVQYKRNKAVTGEHNTLFWQ